MRWLMRLVGKLTFLQLLIITLALSAVFSMVFQKLNMPPRGLSQSIKRFERQRQEEWEREEQQALEAQQAIQSEQQDRQNESDYAGAAVTENNEDE